MINLLKQFWHDLWYSEEKATLWARGFLTWAGAIAGQVALGGTKALADWRTWVVSAVSGTAVMFKAGDKNKTP